MIVSPKHISIVGVVTGVVGLLVGRIIPEADVAGQVIMYAGFYCAMLGFTLHFLRARKQSNDGPRFVGAIQFLGLASLVLAGCLVPVSRFVDNVEALDDLIRILMVAGTVMVILAIFLSSRRP